MGQILAFEQDLTAPNFGRWHRQEPDQRHHRHGFARTRFTHHTQQFARLQREADIVDGMDLTAAGAKNRLEVPDIKDKGRGPIGHQQMLPILLARRFLWWGERLKISATLT